MDYNQLLELVKSRRTVRRFRPDPVPDEYVDKIIEVARWAPSGLNSQWFTSMQTAYVSCLLKHLLGIPVDMEVYDMLVIGYPPRGSEAGPKLMRDEAKMVHYDYCGPEAFRSDEEVRDYIRKFRGG